MSEKISINKFKPRASRFVFKDKTFELKPFSLASQVWADSEFSTSEQSQGLVNLSNLMREVDSQAIAKVCYKQLKDKSEFGSHEELLDFFNDEYKFLATVLPAVTECITGSQPTSEDVSDEEIELKK